MITEDAGTRLVDGRYCPKCQADWRGTQIPPRLILDDVYGHEPPCQRKRLPAPTYGYDGTPCTCGDRYYSRLHGIEYAYNDPRHYDGVSEWMCPDCETRWNRWTGEQL